VVGSTGPWGLRFVELHDDRGKRRTLILTAYAGRASRVILGTLARKTPRPRPAARTLAACGSYDARGDAL